MQPSSNSGLTSWPAGDSSGPQYLLRAFADKACDLDVDFTNTRQPHLVTQIVSSCLLFQDKQLPENEVWSWTLKMRLQALSAIAMATRGSELVLYVHCSNSLCGERIELSLDLAMFQQDIAEEEFVFHIEDKTLTARLPNGWDQHQWLQHQDDPLAVIAKKLVLHIDDEKPGDHWNLPDEWLTGFGEALEKHDELMTLQLNSKCPVCAQDLEIGVDLEAQLLTSLSYVQKKLLLDVHQLALAYHWTEKEILGLSLQRKNFYLMQLRDVSDGAVSQ